MKRILKSDDEYFKFINKNREREINNISISKNKIVVNCNKISKKEK